MTRELLATLRAGDVVELRSIDGPELVLRGQLSTWAGSQSGAEQLVLGNPDTGMILTTRSLNPATWAFGMNLTVVSQVPRLYENSRRTAPAVGDVVRDADGDVWHQHPVTLDRWHMGWGDGPADGHSLAYVQSFGPLTLLWDGETGSLPGATS